MVKTHEIDYDISSFNQLISSNIIIINDPNKEINKNDYILFREKDDDNQYTDLYLMTQVININKNEGLKEGYVMLIINKF